jgi:radical SAM superfamily enzyme YgiQ (UPF0313 family)
MSKLYLISPQSNLSTEYARLTGPRSGQNVTRVASASIATVAALAPASFDVRLCDETVQEIDFQSDADVVGISANVSQALRAIDIAKAFRARGKRVVMGGPHVSLAPDLFAAHADCLVVGELEPVASDFFGDLESGDLDARYSGGKADMTSSPAPRWDLYPNERAIMGVVQTSRGCPFECHFCDVIQYLGRVQRHKTVAQVIAEIQALYNFGYNLVSLADDNFTVYRRRAKELLTAIAGWNGADGRDYITFATQMSIDAARDDEILDLCNQAGLLNAFIGIETSNVDALIESKKRQNLRIDLVEQCRKIARAGIRIEGGLMVGFDSDDRRAFARQFEFAMALPVPTFNVSVLVAPVATPLFDKLAQEGRIISDEIVAQFPSATLVTNFEPAQMSRGDLYLGAKWMINRLFDPKNFFTRYAAMAELLTPPPWGRAEAARHRLLARRDAAALFSRVMREMARRDARVGTLIQRSFALMKARPEIREGLTDILTHYLMTRRTYELDGVIVRGWEELEAPPFGTDISMPGLAHERSRSGTPGAAPAFNA